jgi:hypothetical protein
MMIHYDNYMIRDDKKKTAKKQPIRLLAQKHIRVICQLCELPIQIDLGSPLVQLGTKSLVDAAPNPTSFDGWMDGCMHVSTHVTCF